MRIIPVIDLLGGQAVHAVKGERKYYLPVKSVLCSTSDPITIARSFRDRLGLNEIYIADLDAIQSAGRSNHRALIADLAQKELMSIILDAGVSDIENARAWLDLGIHKVIIGSETLETWDALQDIPAAIAPGHLAFSLDLRAGKIVSPCSALAAMAPIEALKSLHSAGWHEIIVLDLKRVGSEKGADYCIATGARATFPGLRLLIGGGIADPEEVAEIKANGINGVLLATALHRGTIGAEHISAFRG
jgi:phosphoribosylformimino-5-aminoimidazole carboxamide ribotide isomerase